MRNVSAVSKDQVFTFTSSLTRRNRGWQVEEVFLSSVVGNWNSVEWLCQEAYMDFGQSEKLSRSHLSIVKYEDFPWRCPDERPVYGEWSGVLFEISRILNTGLDMETLSICVRLCEQGINPEALSSVIKELRKATEALK
ncbi:PREDICTED: mitotic-spindle organizing protein 1, partial [Nestor notabilis]|uniref:mitotic-spindle organizing protein 1 n=1 Tax=Nestor notabilis TaxID=176057 RepID=UPI000523BF3D